jgi:hypothetical protein
MLQADAHVQTLQEFLLNQLCQTLEMPRRYLEGLRMLMQAAPLPSRLDPAASLREQLEAAETLTNPH